MGDNPTLGQFLFGAYMLELGKFFKDKFGSFKYQANGDNIALQVFYGTPRAAFRYYQDKYNGVVKLPMLNYHFGSFTRLKGFERVGKYINVSGQLDESAGTMPLMPMPVKYDIPVSCQLWNNSYRERDYMLHAIITSFPLGRTNLMHYPDPVNYPDDYLFMPIDMEDEIRDDTEIEGLSEKETRDRVRTTFSLKFTEAVVPYDSFRADVVTPFVAGDPNDPNDHGTGGIYVVETINDYLNESGGIKPVTHVNVISTLEEP